eukprot:TRINITY_DN1085_c0_g1_i2.p2 TRINITY_DN1085_c0_g1~~TRINITY_DN1085_c0_g1_i2.p2  ORF type:complete len:261 (-),score=67.29 TRINITY_DN1085_c0_g1_i2:218-1000(-)
MEKTLCLLEEGKTVIHVAVGNIFFGTLAVSDMIKPGAAKLVRWLRNESIDVWMLTGDHVTTANIIASKIRITPEHVVAGVLPSEKAQKIEELQREGKKVLMVGDGINDAIALAQADVSVAVGTAADLSLQLADVVLLTDNLSRFSFILEISRATFRHVKINLGWAFIYNIIMLPVAAGALYVPTKFSIPPGLAGLSELFSCIPVLLFPLFMYLYLVPRGEGRKKEDEGKWKEKEMVNKAASSEEEERVVEDSDETRLLLD